MKKLILACSLLLATTGAQAQGTLSNPSSRPAQAYTTLGPAGAGVYRDSKQRDNYSTTSNARKKPAGLSRRVL
jgi:predicted carbohydrate-binding protein with CBM5 and CBM33 domain